MPINTLPSISDSPPSGSADDHTSASWQCWHAPATPAFWQNPRNTRRKVLPPERIDRSLMMVQKHTARALIELMEVGKTPSGADLLLHHAPEPFDGVEVAVRPPRWLRLPEERISQAFAVGVRQLGYLLNMMKPQLSGVLQPARAVSARTVTCRGPAVPRSCSRLSEKRTARLRPVPLLPPLERKGCGPSTLMSSA